MPMPTHQNEVLDLLLEHGQDHARTILIKERQKELAPLYHLVVPDEQDVLVPCRWSNDFEKEVTVSIVKSIAREKGAVAVLFMTEAWMSIQTPEEHKRQAGWMRPSLDPKRIEAVIIAVSDGNEMRMVTLEMKRGPTGRVTDLVRDAKIDSNNGSVMSWMVDGIIPPKTIN